MKNILNAPFIIEMCETTANMYRQGWDERNGGNISYMLDENEVYSYLDRDAVIREIPLGFSADTLVGKIFIVTGTGKYFKNVLAAGTPFSFDGAKECFRLGVASIIISAAVALVSAIAAGVVTILENSLALNSNIETSITFSTGLFFMFLSLIFKYGAELQPAPEKIDTEQVMPDEEDYQSEPDSFE
jgi:hypothetical protein